jgi:hypothetical protein
MDEEARMPILVTPSRNPNQSRVSNPLWWFVCQMLANWPGSTNSGTFAPKTGSHDTRNNQSSNNYSVRDSLNKQGPGDKCAAFDQSFPTTDAMVQMGAFVAAAYANNDPRAYALFEALGEADWDYDPEGFVFYPRRLMRVPDRTHKTHWHWGFIRLYMGEDARSWKAMRDAASLLCREALAVWLAGASIFADPAQQPQSQHREDDDVAQLFHIVTKDSPAQVMFAYLGGGVLRVNDAVPQGLANKISEPTAPNAKTKGTGDSTSCDPDEWNSLLKWFGVADFRVDQKGKRVTA